MHTFTTLLPLLLAAPTLALTRCGVTAVQTPVYASRDSTNKCYFSATYTTTTVGYPCGGCTLVSAYAGSGPVSFSF